MKYKLQKDKKHILKKYPETLKSFGAFVGASSLTGIYYGIMTSPSMVAPTVELMLEDQAGGPLLCIGAVSLAYAVSTIKNLRLERRQEKLNAKLEKREIKENAHQDIVKLYEEIQARKRFENIEEQTSNLFSK